jgi:hypothetical protein
MVESANTSANQNLLTARNAVVVVSVVLAISLLWQCAQMLRPNDSGGMARDSYGTRGDGFRGLYEILSELHVSVSRGLAPPTVNGEKARTVALLGPDPQLVLFEPKYLKSLLSWVDAGGRLVVAPAQVRHKDHHDEDDGILGERDILKLLEVNDTVTLQDEPPSDAVVKERESNSRDSQRSGSWQTRDYVPEDVWDAWTYSKPPPRELHVEVTGSLANLASDVRKIAAPSTEFGVLTLGNKKPVGALQIKNDANDDESLLVAVVPRGKGEIIVVSDPELLSNGLIARVDNSVLAAHVLAPQGQAVDFDEYYHGLAVRGNPLYLLTRPGFAATAAAILLVIGIVAWRAAVFLGPPLPDVRQSRRDIQEYVQAMGAFFCRGPGHRHFLISEVRDGVLREICEQLRLPPHTTNVDTIVAALSRRSPDRANTLRKVVADVDGLLAQAGEFPKSVFLSSVQRLAGCL